jgi:hypothetical protein
MRLDTGRLGADGTGIWRVRERFRDDRFGRICRNYDGRDDWRNTVGDELCKPSGHRGNV